MTVPVEVARLIETFERNIESYRQGRYNEAQVRREFIDPFFAALGWDIDNTKGWAEAYKDVIHEDAIRVGGATKAPDYCFRIGGTRKFFLEAKKPSVNIKDAPDPAYQLRRYAWSAKLPLSILTDFEEFAVYDCRIQPNRMDKPSKARILYYTYDQYAEKWDEIASIFSRDAVLKGSFDKYAVSEKRKRGTAEVDTAFLAEIERWRDMLARNIALRNPELTNRQLNYVVQITIDRIIFLRICEDRGIEPSGQLQGFLGGTEVYARLVALFRRADDRFNSGLFHFMREKDRTEGPDELTPELAIDDRPLKDILRSLYYPDSPYEFSVLPAEILGQVYEQFLGKVIALTAGHHARVEDKPEVKKAGGVYYTPSYIVDYIVEHTVGKLLEDRRVEVTEVSRGRGKKRLQAPTMNRPLRVLDPACGSGSFLLGAYQKLLDWYRDYYEKNSPQTWARFEEPPIACAPDGSWKLTTAERKRILLEHIYGVDIDPQAVEVTKLSLLLRVLEGEKNLVLFHNERALPDLADNIKCGNSLIGPDFYQGQQATMFDEDGRLRINAFDWHAEFPHVFKDDGFDAVIGNPPYIRIQTLKETQPESIPYFSRHYQAASKGNYDIYVVFVEQALRLLTPAGRMGYILPHKFFNAQYGQPLRKLIADGKHLSHVVHFGDQQVFAGATTYTCLLILGQQPTQSFTVAKVSTLLDWQSTRVCKRGEISHEGLSDGEWNFVVGNDADLFTRMVAFPTKLVDIAHLFVGLQTSADTVFLFKDCHNTPHPVTEVYSKELGSSVPIETALLKPVVRSGEIGRYWAFPSARVLFPYERNNGIFCLISESQLKLDFPLAWTYLVENKTLLSNREHGKFRTSGWHQLYPKNLDVWDQPKIMLPYMITRLAAYYDVNNLYFVNVTTGGFGLTLTSNDLSLQYVTGLLNSRLLDWFLKQVSTHFHCGYFAANKQFLAQLPIRMIGLDDPPDVARHHRMVELVEGMLSLHKSLSSSKTADERNAIQRQIDATDKEIDRLVYELYGLTDDEIRIVEEATR